MKIRDLQTGQEFEGPDGTPFDSTKYAEVSGGEGGSKPAPDSQKYGYGTGDPWASVGSVPPATLLRVLGPLLAATTGPESLIPAMAYSGGLNAASQGTAAGVEGKPVGPAAQSGALSGAASVPIGRILGSLLGVAGAKMGLTSSSGTVDLPDLQKTAGEVANAEGLVGGRVAPAAAKIKEWLDASGGSLPVRAPGFQPSAEVIRKGIPWRQPGGKELYGALREGAAESNPDYDAILRQYQVLHQLLGTPSMKEIVGSMATGGSTYAGNNPWLMLLPFLPRLGKAAQVAPAAPFMQGATNVGLGAALGQ